MYLIKLLLNICRLINHRQINSKNKKLTSQKQE